MPLDPELIKQLINKPKRTGGGGGKGKAKVDTSVRDHVTWFKLVSKLLDEDTSEMLTCENPDCPGTGHMCTEINGHQMCRICFLEGWLSNPDDSQLIIDDD